MELYKRYKTLLTRNNINTPFRLAHFFAQIHHESNLKPISENLNYSSIGLQKIFKKYFPTKEIADAYAKQPEKIANKVYANRMGNGDENSRDGWKYRGRGFIQLTGKNNYKALRKATTIDYVNNPDLLLTEADAMIAAIWFWTENNLNHYADKDDIKIITKKINGGYNGLQHRITLLEHYKNTFLN